MKRISILLLILFALSVSAAWAQTTIPMDPKATYLRTNGDPLAVNAAPISLESLGIKPGDRIRFRVFGDMSYWPEGPDDLVWLACGIFSSSSVLLPSDGLNRVPGALEIREGNLPPCNTLPTAVDGLPTDILQDFGFSSWETATAKVPPRAQWLFLTVVDDFYGDNSDPNGNLSVQIKDVSSFTNLYSFFAKADDGGNPWGGVVLDPAGNLYGTAMAGGNPDCASPWTSGCGTVFKVDKRGTETVLYRFTGTDGDGSVPIAGLVRDTLGNLYGTTLYGGSGDCNDGYGIGCGTVFKVDKWGRRTILHSFMGSPDGVGPLAGLVRDAKGNLYGITSGGGAYGPGAVFKVDASGTETVLYSFTGGFDGGWPWGGGLVLDAEGNLYGTTVFGGAYDAGTVFKVDATGNETVLYSFTGGADGGGPPLGSMILDATGNLYGAMGAGGDYGYGVIFRLSPEGNQTVLHSFTGGTDGANPNASLIFDTKGNLCGTASSGGDYNQGVVFMLDTAGALSVLHSFACETDGCYPGAGLVRDAENNLYGTATYGARFGGGSVYKLTLPSDDDQQ